MKAKIITIIGIVLVIGILLWLTIPYVHNIGPFESNWKNGMRSPKEFYMDKGKKLYDCEKEIDGIRYQFDKGGSVTQIENNGIWKDNNTYYVNNTQLKDIWYFINDKWYYFDNQGLLLKKGFYKINNTIYYINKDGYMNIGMFKDGFHHYFSNDNGEIQRNSSFIYENKSYIADRFGRAHERKNAVICGEK